MGTQNTSFVMWNNKGGVGKSTITFHAASMYAEKNPNTDVVVIDMCPQANSSMMLLGGGVVAEEKIQELITASTPQTVVGYITDIITNSNVEVKDYVTNVNSINDNMPNNLWLLSGDGNLELISPLLSERADTPPLTGRDQPWVRIHSILKELTKKRINEDRVCTYFIDTNPSFSIYTQMAILAGEKLLVPINADDSSIYAISGLFNLIWGGDAQHPVYGKYTFSAKVDSYGMERPKIALLIGNRFTQKIGAANAFKAVSLQASQTMYREMKKNHDRFLDCEGVNTQEEFDNRFGIELRDFNSAGVVSANKGLPLSKMDRREYNVYGDRIQVSKEQTHACKETVEKLVEKIMNL